MNYSELLKDRRWQDKIIEVKLFYGNQCQCCFDRDAYMQVHHKVYYPNTKPWNYEMNDLVLLCPVCHAWVEEFKKNKQVIEICSYIGWNLTDFVILLERLKSINPKQAIELITAQIIKPEDL